MLHLLPGLVLRNSACTALLFSGVVSPRVAAVPPAFSPFPPPDVTIDQLPMLAELRRTLEELSMMDPPDPEPSVVLEQLPEVRDQLL